MAEKIFKTNPERLDYMLSSVHNREVALPDFQRDFVWDPSSTEELIESICQNYPAGSLLKIKNGNGSFFAPRAIKGAPDLADHAPAYLILDGQQRLTSLYQALYEAGDYRYLFCLGWLMDGKDLEDCIFHVRKPVYDRWYSTIEQQAAEFTLPLSVLFVRDGRFDGWLDEVVELRTQDHDEQKELKRRLRAAKEPWIASLEQYEFPVVELSEGTTPAAVCTIFETLNRTGVKLSVFDLLGARFWSKDVRLRDMWDRARNDNAIIAEFEIDPYYLLQVLALHAAKAAPACKRSDILALEASDLDAAWDDAVAGLTGFLTILREDCGVIVPKLLPYGTMLVTGAAALAGARDAYGPEVGVVREKIKRWFWCSALSQGYESGANSAAARDYGELMAWFAGGQEPVVVREFRFDITQLDQVTPRQRALYRSAIALILRNGAIDFHSRQLITAKLVADEDIDDHHLFPAAYLSEHRPDLGGWQQNCVLNRTYIDKITNIRIGKRAPSDYLGEIEDAIGSAKLDALLKSHLLPTGSDSPLRQDDFDGLVAYRRDMLSLAVREVTGN